MADLNASEPFAAELLEAPPLEALEEPEEGAGEEPLELELEDGVEVVEPDDALGSRSRSDRLPRNCGVTSETKFSAMVTPVIRRVATSGPAATLAVRIVAKEGAGAGFWGDRRCHQSAPATISTARTAASQIPAFPGFFGRGCTTSGRLGGGAYGATLGAETTLMSY